MSSFSGYKLQVMRIAAFTFIHIILFGKTGTGSQEEWVLVDFLFLGSFR